MSVIRHFSFFQRRVLPNGQRQVFRTFGKFERVLVVAEMPVAWAVKQPLEENLFDVTVAQSGFDAIQEILDRKFDAVICDTTIRDFPMQMFYTAVERVRPQLLNSFIFLVSADTPEQTTEFIDRVDGLKVWRPIEVHELFQLIEIVLARGAIQMAR
jgi:DNA-binding response OmpR family regulator